MAGGFPVGGQWSAVQAGAITNSAGVILTSSASNNVPGAYVELVSSTQRSSTWLAVMLRDTVTSTGVTVSAVNIAIGASGSEVNVVSDLIVSRASLSGQEGGGASYLFPLSLPAGTRIAANCQSLGVSVAIRCAIMLFDDVFGSPPGGGKVDTYSFNTGTSIGTQVDPGGTANTKGAWTEITPSLTADINGFFVAFDGGAVTPGSVIVALDLDIGVGASGSETVILADWLFVMTCTSTGRRDIGPPTIPFLPISIPAGTRVAARAASSQTTSPSRLFDVTFYGVRA